MAAVTQPRPVAAVVNHYNGEDVARRWWAGNGIRLHLVFYGLFFLAIGFSFAFQEHKWRTARSFALLLVVDFRIWATLALFAGLLKLAAAAMYPRLAVAAITFGSALMAAWTVFFFVAYVASPPDAPPIGALFSAAVLFHHLRALSQLDLRRDSLTPSVSPPVPGPDRADDP